MSDFINMICWHNIYYHLGIFSMHFSGLHGHVSWHNYNTIIKTPVCMVIHTLQLITLVPYSDMILCYNNYGRLSHTYT